MSMFCANLSMLQRTATPYRAAAHAASSYGATERPSALTAAGSTAASMATNVRSSPMSRALAAITYCSAEP